MCGYNAPPNRPPVPGGQAPGPIQRVRRRDVKTPAKKATKAASKKAAKPLAPAKKVSAKSAVKTVAKPAAKAKPVAKAVKVAAAKKPSAKAVKTPAPKAPVPKAAAKAAPAQKGAKTAKSTASAKPVPAKKGAVTAPKAALVAKPSNKQPAASGKASAKPSPSKPVVTPITPPQTVAKAPLAQTMPAPDVPVRSSRPSARLAQITVPSMPQAVASTAAKASFLPQMPTTVLPTPAAPAKKDPKLANNWKNKPVEQLTDAEVLAMSDDEYMNDAQMAFFRLKLVQLKQDILANAGETTEHLREDTVVVPDPADRATIEEEHALELRTRDRERKLLKKIEQSIARIDAGDYGYCDETGEPIGVGRLLARPTATLSLEAQQRRELKQKMFGD